MSVAQSYIDEGISHQQAGELEKAENLYRTALELEPRNSIALHLLGLVVVESGRAEDGAKLIEAAIRSNPDNPIFLNSLGHAYRSMGAPDLALECLRRALELKPDYAEAYVNIGAIWQAQHRVTAAADAYRRAISLNPGLLAAHGNLAEILKISGRLVESRASYLNAIHLAPANPGMYLALAIVLLELPRDEEAQACIRQYLGLAPDPALAYSNVANALRLAGRLTDAEASGRRALELNPRLPDAYNNLAAILFVTGRYEEAAAQLHRAIELNPQFARAYSNLGATLLELGKFNEAVAACRRAIEIEPHVAGAYANLSAIWQAQGRLDKAEPALRRALELEPQSAATNWPHALQKLLKGDYEEGLRLYECRFDAAANRPTSARERAILRDLASVPRWDGEDLRGKRLLMWTEQGLGDTVMMSRYFWLARQRGASEIMVSCTPELDRLLRLVQGVDVVLSGIESLDKEAFDVHCPLMSLPFCLGTRLDTIPNDIPYIYVSEGERKKWADRIKVTDGFKVGIAWRGNKENPKDHTRSVALDKLAAIGAVKGVQLISLQKDATQTELDLMPQKFINWMPECGDLADTAGLIQALDLVITVDTVVAHLAGALGKPVWLLNRYESEWRWMLEREDSPWYPTMRIFRQKRWGDWEGAIASIASALAELLRASR